MTQRKHPDPAVPNAPVCAVRRFAGPEADELFILCRPEPSAVDDIARQTESVYRMLHNALRGEGGGLEHVVHETIYFRNIQGDRAAFEYVRDKLFAKLSGRECRPA